MEKHKFLMWFTFLFIGMVNVYAQQSTLNGKVLDGNGEPLIGVSIQVKNTSRGTITDFNGNFSVEVISGETLIISYIGYLQQEIAITNQKTLNVTMAEDSQTLDEVVVVGYGSQSKRKVTTAISNVDSETLTRSASTTTAGALSGKMSGLSTRAKDSRPGRGIQLEIRNMGKPLYVIDGVPYGGEAERDWLGLTRISGEDAFNALNLEDIENISILKDASAAIYGLRAANGVVLVTTNYFKWV